MYKIKLHLEAAGDLEFESVLSFNRHPAPASADEAVWFLEENYPFLKGHFTVVPEPV